MLASTFGSRCKAMFPNQIEQKNTDISVPIIWLLSFAFLFCLERERSIIYRSSKIHYYIFEPNLYDD